MNSQFLSNHLQPEQQVILSEDLNNITHQFCGCFLIGYWGRVFEGVSGVISDLMIIKDQVMGSALLASMNYYEPANALLRSAFEVSIFLCSELLECRKRNVHSHTHIEQTSINIAKKTMSEEIKYLHEEGYKVLYAKLSSSVHRPRPSICHSDYEKPPIFSDYDCQKYKDNLLSLVNIISVMIIGTSLKLEKVPKYHLSAHKDLVPEEYREVLVNMCDKYRPVW